MKYKNTLNKSKPGYGVGEWAEYSYNIGTGCINNCRYCYARDIAVSIAERSNKSFSREDWEHEQVKTWKAEINQKVNDWVMFPSMHDISPKYLETYKQALRNLLEAGNNVLIVTKPRLQVIQELCNEFTDHKGQILFRFTITSLNPFASKFWEQNAPTPKERLESLEHAFNEGYQTSVSVEPMLETVERTVDLYERAIPYITEDIWFGRMNNIQDRVQIKNDSTKKAVEAILQKQSDDNIQLLYNQLKDKAKVKWKDSIRRSIKRAA